MAGTTGLEPAASAVTAHRTQIWRELPHSDYLVELGAEPPTTKTYQSIQACFVETNPQPKLYFRIARRSPSIQGQQARTYLPIPTSRHRSTHWTKNRVCVYSVLL